MPYVNFVYKAMVFQMISVKGDPALQNAIKKAEKGDKGEPAGEKRHKFVINVPYQRMHELFLTKREVWYFEQKAFDVTKCANPVVEWYDQILDEVSKVSGVSYRKDIKLARITIHTFSEASGDSSNLEVSVAHFTP